MQFLNKIMNSVMMFFGDENSEKKNNQEKNNSNNGLKKNPNRAYISKRKQSRQDSQGVSDFSGSGYNGPGNVDHEKRNSNMSQRNY